MISIIFISILGFLLLLFA